jgi:hypothetical protein
MTKRKPIKRPEVRNLLQRIVAFRFCPGIPARFRGCRTVLHVVFPGEKGGDTVPDGAFVQWGPDRTFSQKNVEKGRGEQRDFPGKNDFLYGISSDFPGVPYKKSFLHREPLFAEFSDTSAPYQRTTAKPRALTFGEGVERSEMGGGGATIPHFLRRRIRILLSLRDIPL